MKTNLLLLAIIFSFSAFAQPWLQSELTTNNLNQLSLSDHQEAFEAYWSGKDIQNGYYTENGVQKKAYGWKQYKRWENFW